MRNNVSNPRQGLRQIKLRKDEADLVMIAFQLYVQAGGAATG